MTKKKPHVLIAEDDIFLADMMRETFQGKGFDAVIVSNGKDAIAAIDLREPDLLILDILMPKIDGYGVLEHLKGTGSTFPVVVCSNVSDRLDKQKCMKLGCLAYLVKSDMDQDGLWPAVKKFLKSA